MKPSRWQPTATSVPSELSESSVLVHADYHNLMSASRGVSATASFVHQSLLATHARSCSREKPCAKFVFHTYPLPQTHSSGCTRCPFLFSLMRCQCQHTPPPPRPSSGGGLFASAAIVEAPPGRRRPITENSVPSLPRRAPPRQVGHQCARGGRGRGDRAGDCGRVRSPRRVGGRAAVAGARCGGLFLLRFVGLGVPPPLSAVGEACAWLGPGAGGEGQGRHDGASGEVRGGRAAAGRGRHRG